MNRLLIAATALTALPAPVLAQSAPPPSSAPATVAPAAPNAARPRTFVAPYIEASQIFSADLESGDAVTYTTLSAGIDAGIQTARAEGQISYRYDRFIGWDDDAGDGDVHTGLARGSLLVAPGLAVEAGALATRARSDIRGAAPGFLLADSPNTSQVYSVYAGPTLTQQLGVATLGALYRFGYTKAETPSGPLGIGPNQRRRDFFDEATNHLVSANLTVRPGALLPVGLGLSGAYEREDAGQLDQYYEGYFVRGDVLAPVSPTLALTAGVGYEEIETGSRTPLVDPATGLPVLDDDGRFRTDPASPARVAYRTDGVFYDAGVVWRPNRRTELTARAGERFGSFTATGSLAYQASETVGVGVVVYDGIQTFGRQLRTGLANLPTSFISARDQFVQQYNGCVFGTTGQAPGGCLNAVFQSINTTSYRARGIDGVITATRGRNQFGLGAGYANRRLHTGDLPVGVTVFGVEDESAYLQAFYGHALTDVSGFDAQAFVNWYNTVGLDDDQVFGTGAVASYYHRFGRLQTVASAGIYSFQVGDFSDSLTAQVLLGARYTFGGVQ